jgi:hypothetical protein
MSVRIGQTVSVWSVAMSVNMLMTMSVDTVSTAGILSNYMLTRIYNLYIVATLKALLSWGLN